MIAMKPKAKNFAFYLFTFTLLGWLCGCSVVQFVTPERPPYDQQFAQSYEHTILKQSNSADVLTTIHIPEHELLSQSKSVIASTGQKKKGYKTWLKMVAFDENELTAQRKYLLIADERPRFLFVEPWEALRFDCEMVLDSKVLDEPYANENARRIAILRHILESARSDIDELAQDNKTITVCGMLINQALEAALVKLDSSPALAVKLSDENGLGFEHNSFDKGRIKLAITDDIASVKILLGSLVKRKVVVPTIKLKDKKTSTAPEKEQTTIDSTQ